MQYGKDKITGQTNVTIRTTQYIICLIPRPLWMPDNNVGWPNDGQTSVQSSPSWANVNPTYIAVRATTVSSLGGPTCKFALSTSDLNFSSYFSIIRISHVRMFLWTVNYDYIHKMSVCEQLTTQKRRNKLYIATRHLTVTSVMTCFFPRKHNT